MTPQARRTRAVATNSAKDVPGYTNETALRARALEIDEESLTATGRPAGIRPLRLGLAVGSEKATELRDWLASQREQRPAVVEHANGHSVS